MEQQEEKVGRRACDKRLHPSYPPANRIRDRPRSLLCAQTLFSRFVDPSSRPLSASPSTSSLSTSSPRRGLLRRSAAEPVVPSRPLFPVTSHVPEGQECDLVRLGPRPNPGPRSRQAVAGPRILPVDSRAAGSPLRTLSLPNSHPRYHLLAMPLAIDSICPTTASSEDPRPQAI